jgi:hypothetical protein
MFTVEQSRALRGELPGAHTKNLLLVYKNGRMVLVVAKDDTRVDLKTLAERLRLGRLSFGKAPLLEAALGVSPGSVTPFALTNDTETRLKVVVDAALLGFAEVNCHPLVNSAHDAAADLRASPLHRRLRAQACRLAAGRSGANGGRSKSVAKRCAAAHPSR